MAVMTTDVRRGMSVYDSGGHKIGSVLEIYGSQYGADEPGLAPPQGQTPSGDPLPFGLYQS